MIAQQRTTQRKAKEDSTDKLLNRRKTSPVRKTNASRRRHSMRRAQQRKAATANTSEGNSLKIIPLGGQEEVGRNMTIFEYNRDIVLLDMGIQFAEEDMPGIDYIIPNISYLKGKEQHIKGVILSHGHLDHIGAVPHLIPELGYPLLIGSPMTLALAKKRMEDFHHSQKLKTLEIKSAKKTLRLGKLTINFFNVTHSIMDAVGVIISTPFINVIHMGDWRYDLDPVRGTPTSFAHLSRWNKKNSGKPSVLMMESLGAVLEGSQGSEREVYENIKQIIIESKGKVIIGTFSSMIERIGQVIEIAEKLGKKVAVDGFSMKTNVEIGKRFGYIKARPSTLIDIKRINDYPSNKIVIICTGAQGEGNAVLMRIANNEHRFVEIEPHDTIVFSSSVIPGNERSVQRLKDSLYRKGANVIHKEIMDVHAGGHAKQDDIKRLLQEIKPDFLIPVYAHHYMLWESAKLATGQGMDPQKIFIADNGQIIEFFPVGRGVTGRLTKKRVPSEYVFVDGLGVGDISNVVLRDRKVMSSDGMLVVIATVDTKTGRLINNPDLISRGFIYMKENKKLVEDTRRKAIQILKDEDPRSSANQVYIKDKIRNELGQFLFQRTKRRPMILPVVIEV